MNVKRVLLVAMLLGVAACRSTNSKATVASSLLHGSVVYTPADPSSIVADKNGGWFAFGSNINGISGVGLVVGGAITEFTKADPFVVDHVAAGDGTVWYSAADKVNGSDVGEIGRVTGDGHLISLTRLRTFPDDLSYDGRSKRLYFSLPHAFGWRDVGDTITLCNLPAQTIDRRHAPGPTHIAAGKSAVWVFDSGNSSLFRVTHNCEHTAPVAIELGGERAEVPGIVVDDSNSVWLLDAKDGSVISVSRSGQMSINAVHVSGRLTAIGRIGRHVCVASTQPAELSCDIGSHWQRSALPLQGVVSSVASYGGAAWLAYVGVANEDRGAILSISLKDLGL